MTETLAVVPIFMSAGAAVLPTVIAAVMSVGAILFKPRELVRVCKAHPLAAGMTVLVLVLVGTGGWAIAGRSKAAVAKGADASAQKPVDWAQVAQDIIARERAGMAPSIPGAVPVAVAAPASTPAAGGQTPVAVKEDFSRTNSDGATSPERLQRVWKYQPEATMFLARPAVANNRLYVAGSTGGLGGYSGLLACLDMETGKAVWEIAELPTADQKRLKQFSLPPFASSPAVTADGKYLVIGQGMHEDKNSALLCFDTETHALKWAVQTPIHIESSPAIFGDMAVVAGAIEGPDGKAVGNTGYVFAVRISDGKELWRQPVNDPESSPAIDEKGMVYIGSGFNGNAVAAIRSESDEELKKQDLPRLAWQTTVPFPATGDVTLAGDLVVVGTGNGDLVHSNYMPRGLVIAMDRKTGEIRWQADMGDSVLGSIAFRDGVLICPSRTGQVLAISAKNGEILWRTNISGKAAVLAGTAFTGKRIYAISSDGYLAILDPKDGKMIGQKIALNDPKEPGAGLTACPPQVVGNAVIAGSETGGIVRLLGTGEGEAAR